MAKFKRANVFGKLNSVAYRTFEAATTFCKLKGNSEVTIGHWLHQTLQLQDSDLHRIIRHFELEVSRLSGDLTNWLDQLPGGATSIDSFSPNIDNAVREGWSYATLHFGETQVRIGYVVVALLRTDSLSNVLPSISKEFDKIKADVLVEKFDEIVGGSPEDGLVAKDGFQIGGGAVPGEASGAMSPAQLGKKEALTQFTTDLTEQARSGKMDPIVGRDDEIRQIVDILMRRRQNNPILTGEAGVGKTAVVEGFAQRIVKGDVPKVLQNVELRSLDVGLLQAGASMKGEFENRLRQVIEEVQSSETPIILFIDEAHTLVGAGGAAGTGDAANLLKPALARGELRTVAATTWAEYKKHIEKDPALTRRFQVIQVDEPSEERAILMMRGIASKMESHHDVQILDEALEASVKYSHRYIPARQLPDKSVSLLDTAAARVAIGQQATPPEVDDSRRRIESLETEMKIIEKEKSIGVETAARETRVTESLESERERLKELEERWKQEDELVTSILDKRAKLRGFAGKVEGTGSDLEKGADDLAKKDAEKPSDKGSATEAEPKANAADVPQGEDRDKLLAELQEIQGQLDKLQGETPLILPCVDDQAIASVVADWTGIPVGSMVKDEIAAILKLADRLNERVIGQKHALEMIARRVQTSRAQMDNPNKPIGVFMLAGPSGVGKTETALALAEAMYGGEQNVVTINMSEFQEAHTVSTLKGAPPGYVGYGEGGILTEAVRRKPYSVVLLDEVEKAHSDVHEIFFQVFDKGQMEDGEGRMIDFKNTLILLTSNVGSDTIMALCRDLPPGPDLVAKKLREPLLKVFPAALLGRIVTIPYYPLSDEMVGEIAKLQLGRIEKRVNKNHGIPFVYSDDVIELIVKRCTEVESGGRMIDSILTNTVLPTISEKLLTCAMEGQPVKKVEIQVADEEFAYDFA